MAASSGSARPRWRRRRGLHRRFLFERRIPDGAGRRKRRSLDRRVLSRLLDGRWRSFPVASGSGVIPPVHGVGVVEGEVVVVVVSWVMGGVVPGVVA